MHRWLPWLLVGLTAVGCGSKRFVAVERWTEAPELRVAVVRHGDSLRMSAVAGATPLELDLEADAPARGGTEIWLFGYRKANLLERFPGLADADPAEILAALSPTTDPSGSEAPPADEVLFAKLEPGTSNPLSYASKTWDSAGALKPRLIVRPSAYCGGIAVERFSADPGRHLDGLAVPEEERPVFLVSRLPYSSSATVTLSRLEGQRFVEIAPVTTGSVADKIAYDPVSRSLWVAGAFERPIHLSLEGAPLPVPEIDGLPARASRFSAARDGTVMGLLRARSVSGLRPLAPFALRGSMWQTAMKNGEIFDYSFEILDVAGEGRAAAWFLCWIATYRDPLEASGWHNELVDPLCNHEGVSYRSGIRDLAGDADQYLAVGNAGFVAFRNDAARFWPPVDDPSSGSLGIGYPNLFVALALGDRRALVAGDNGFVALRTHGAWCPVEVGVKSQIFRGAASPSNRVVYLLSDEPGHSSTTLLRVRLPRP